MKYLHSFFLFSLLPFNIIAQSSSPETVSFVDLKKYVGLWYEIAKLPNSFQDHCIKGTTARYSINEDGEIEVLNSCIDEDNQIDEADGIARIVVKKTNSRLEVSFVSFLGWRPFWGDYWIIGLNKNYEWAIVGTPDRKYGSILSRTKKIEPEVLENI